MSSQELIDMAMRGEVVGDGREQIQALVEELRKRPKAILIDTEGNRHDDVFAPSDSPAILEPATPVEITIEAGDRRWRFAEAFTTETPQARCEYTVERRNNDCSAFVVIRGIRPKPTETIVQGVADAQ